MSKRGINSKAWPRRILAIIISSLSVLTSLSLLARPAAAAPPQKTTTTTTATSGGGGSTGGGGVATPKLTAVVALSQHRALATYDRDLDAAALQVSSYLIYSTQAVNLPVGGVSRASNNQVYLLTGAQEPVTYEMKKPKTSKPIRFTGSTLAEPKLLSARPLSTKQIVVSFSEPVGPSALQPSMYQITLQGSTTTLAVTGVALYGSSGKEVLITTAPQDAVSYVLTVGDIQGTNGAYVDPTASTIQLTGSTVPAGPMLLNATADGGTRIILTFDTKLDPVSATNPANYTATPNLSITSATLQADNKQVVLETSQQYQLQYSIVANVEGEDGAPVNPSFNSVSFTGNGPVISNDRPKVTSAASTGNTSVVVQFSKPMADNAADPSRYVIVQTVVHPEVAFVGIKAAEFVDANRLSVKLTTESQAEVTYQVTANNVTDVLGNPLADKTNVAGVIVDPTSFTFPGTPPSYLPCPREGAPTPCVVIDERVNSDDDTLYNHEETRGWQITIKLANGDTQVRQITSNPYSGDTDNDGLKDHDERALNIDPRDHDTDDDGIGDEPEFNVYYTDPTNQDSDADGLFDGLETSFFLTSPIFDDTDGDQLKDGYEINVNRNPKVADLPQPLLKVGETRMGLDVRFIESNGQSTRQLDAKSVEATLVQSSSQEYSSSESATHESSTKLAGKVGLDYGYSDNSPHVVFHFEQSTENTDTNSFTSGFTQSSSVATEQAYTNSLTTQVEAAQDSTVTREIVGANLQLAVTLESKGNVGFTAKNLQVAALIQDPDDPTRLTPISTLVPETGVDTSFTLGPLVPPKGPIVFSSTTVYPQLVETLMNNPRGLVFRFANYDIVDEAGRNFAFTSQEVNDRTARIAIDYGGFDPDGDGRGEQSEILRVATGIIGRVVDTNGDGKVDEADRKVVFDPSGKQVGLTVRDALAAAGLKHYDEAANPSSTLSLSDKQGSYSTLKSPDGTSESVFRVRNRQVQAGSRKAWEIVGRTGIDRSLTLDERILYPGTNVTLMFLEDADGDRLPALTEAIHGCKESDRDSDDDGLDDRFEVLVGWEVENPLGIRQVRSRCNADDSDLDGLKDRQEAPSGIHYDSDGLVLFETDLPSISPSRTVSDLKVTERSAIVESKSGNLATTDVGQQITGGSIPAECTRILSVQSLTLGAMRATMSAPAGDTDTNTSTNSTSIISASIGSPYTGQCKLSLGTTAGSAVVTSASPSFMAQDVGMLLTGPVDGPIPATCARILSVQSSTQATLTANATATASGVAASMGSPYNQNCEPHRISGWPRKVSDLATTTGSAAITSASANFAAGDVGVPISGLTLASGIPNNTTILSVQSPTQATMSQNATATASGVEAFIGSDIEAALADPITDPVAKDTDFDGLWDNFELTPYKNALNLPMRQTSPEHPDTERDGLTDGVERRLGGDPRVDDSDSFTDSDRDGLMDSEEVGDDNSDFVIDDSERGNAGWNVTVTQMHRRLDSTLHPYEHVGQLSFSLGDNRYLVRLVDGQRLEAGMVVDIKEEGPTAPALNTSVVKVEHVFTDTIVTFGDTFVADPSKTLKIYRTICKNGTCPAQKVTTVEAMYSSKFDPDTDDDGLTDLEEKNLKTDPGCRLRTDPTDSSKKVLDCKPNQTGTDLDGDGVRDGWDTDGDGLTDFQEVRGFKLADGTTVKTKPTYVDTDNDRRSDGDEAGLPGGEFIVRLPGGVVYQASSHPNRPDSDFDLLVDGDEQLWAIDPTKANTDGDSRTDYSEILAGRRTRPDVPDMLVTMNFSRLEMKVDGEKNDDAGDFRFEFFAVKPDGTSPLVVHSGKEDLPGAPKLPLDGLHPEYGTTGGNCPGDNRRDQCWHTTSWTVVRIHDLSGVPFTSDGSGREVVIGSVSTTDAVPEEFGIKGYLAEYDLAGNDRLACRYDIFPDIFGNAADGTGVVKGSQLRLGTQSMAIHRTGGDCGDGESVDFTLMVSYTAL